MTTKIEGELEIDHERGVIYFHNKIGYTTLRICQLPKPIPQPKAHALHPNLLKLNRNPRRKPIELYQLDYTFQGVNTCGMT